jgi:hypothetical protein
MTELALDDEQRHALARHLHRVRVPRLMGHKATAHVGSRGDIVQLGPDTGGRPRATAG